jgi:hypothetical protein
MKLRSILILAAALALPSWPAAAAGKATFGYGVVTGGGYAAFDAGGSPGDNLYWVSSFGGPRLNRGLWYADVFIDFPGSGDFDFEALYQTDCVFVDRHTREAWIDGTIIQSNDPANLGLRATLYINDGGPGGDDFHGITPLAADAPRDQCRTRPEPDFRERAQSGNYLIH